MYVCKKWFRLLALIGLITLTLPLAVDTPPPMETTAITSFPSPKRPN